jgi:cold shock CspA family protein
MKGTVIWFAPFKNFGFISGEDGNNLFISSTALSKGAILNVDDPVEYTMEESAQGLKATNVKFLKTSTLF